MKALNYIAALIVAASAGCVSNTKPQKAGYDYRTDPEFAHLVTPEPIETAEEREQRLKKWGEEFKQRYGDPKQQERDAYFARNLSLHPSLVFAINAGEVVRGMDAEQVILSWGRPEQINKSEGGFGVREQWVYGNGNYLYFRNGKLDSWQTRE